MTTLGTGVVVFGVVFPRMVDFDEVAAAFSNTESTDLCLIGFLLAARWAAMGGVYASVAPGVSLRRSLSLYFCGSAVATVIPGPVDLAVRYRYYRRWQQPAAEAKTSIAAAGVFTVVTRLCLLLAAVGLAVTGGSNTGTWSSSRGTFALVACTVVLIVLMAGWRWLPSSRWLGAQTTAVKVLVQRQWHAALIANAAAVSASIL